ncbi:MAG TPA: diaminobutyrate acetyltransferase [Pseudonocardiaceae bacterium]|nr:diaminobutyrate acetyltransferase [Pseudonocardiaceae bacterium]
MSAKPNRVGGGAALADDITFDVPGLPDAAKLWRIAKDSAALDLNSSYAYLLWCRDFADTSVVARYQGDVIGFVTGYRRPTSMDTLLVWQVAVDDSHRGHGVAARLLDDLLNRLVPQGIRYMETTVTEDNTASNRLFQSLALRRRAGIDRTELFGSADFPDDHETEFRYRIGPL